MSQPRPLAGFNGLRALACLSVLIYHLNQHRSVTALALWNWDLYQAVEMWPVAVSAFFILSAITNSLPFWRSIIRNLPAPNTGDVIVSRFFRIAPAFYLVLIFTFFLSIFLNGYSDGAFIRLLSGLTFLSWLHPFTFFPVDLNGPLWYIAYDMMGVLFVIGIMSLLVRIRKIFIPLVFVATGSALMAMHIWWTSLPFPTLTGVVSEWFPAYNPFIFGLHFLIGLIVAGILIYQEKYHTHHSRWYDLFFILIAS